MSAELKRIIRNTFGWKSVRVEQEIDKVVESIRLDEYNRCAKVMFQILVDNLHLPVSQLVENIRKNSYEYGSRTDASTEQVVREDNCQEA